MFNDTIVNAANREKHLDSGVCENFISKYHVWFPEVPEFTIQLI